MSTHAKMFYNFQEIFIFCGYYDAYMWKSKIELTSHSHQFTYVKCYSQLGHRWVSFKVLTSKILHYFLFSWLSMQTHIQKKTYERHEHDNFSLEINFMLIYHWYDWIFFNVMMNFYLRIYKFTFTPVFAL